MQGARGISRVRSTQSHFLSHIYLLSRVEVALRDRAMGGESAHMLGATLGQVIYAHGVRTSDNIRKWMETVSD